MIKTNGLNVNNNIYQFIPPIADSLDFGGIKANAKTSNDTVPVHIDSDGFAWIESQLKTSDLITGETFSIEE